MENLKRKKKILVVNTNETGKNGVTNVIYNYLQAMTLHDMQIDVIAINSPERQYFDIINKLGGELFVVERSSKKVLTYWNSLRKIIRKGCYDAVHIHGNSHTVVVELSAAWLAGCPIRIVHSHNTQCEHAFIHRVMTPLFNRLVTHGLACGNAAGRWMFGKKSFCVINNGVDTKKFAYDETKREMIRAKYNWSSSCIVLGHVGYFYEVKNHRLIVKVFRELFDNNPNYRWLLIGDGPLRQSISDALKNDGLLSYSVLTGNINNVEDYVNAMDVVLMPSIFEGLPLTLIEQQANGLQCVVSENITREVDKTGNVKFLSLEQPLQDWVNSVQSCGGNRNERSINAVRDIKERGYDVCVEAEKLCDYYTRIIGDKK